MERKRSRKRLRKLVCAITVVAMVMMLMPMTASAAEPEILEDATVREINHPVIGETPDFDAIVPKSDAHYRLATTQEMISFGYEEGTGKNGIIWYEDWNGDRKPMSDTDVFKADTVYKCVVVLVLDEGYKFASKVYCRLNNNGYYQNNESGSDAYFYFTSLDYEASEPKLIKSVDVYGVDMQLEAGQGLFFKGSCNGGYPYHLASTQEMIDYQYASVGRDGFIWFSNGYGVSADAVYEEGEKYEFAAVIIADTGYKFADDVECSINGDKNLVARKNNYGRDLAIISIELQAKKIEKIKTVKILNIDRPVAGKKPDYEATIPAGAPYRLATTKEMGMNSKFCRNGIAWCEVGSWGYIERESIYSAGTNYSFEAWLYANPGYKFADTVKCIINNNSNLTNSYYVSNNGTELNISSNTFTAAPTATKSLSVKLYGYDDIKASWSKVTGATGYKVYYKKYGWKDYKYAGSTTRTYKNIANLYDGYKYYVKVIPYKTYAGKTTYGPSKTSSGIYTLKKLNTPKIYKYSSSKVKVTWNNIYGESGYQISRSTKKKGTNIVATYSTTSGKYKVFKTTRNKTYYYKVRAYKTVDGKKIYAPWSVVNTYTLK